MPFHSHFLSPFRKWISLKKTQVSSIFRFTSQLWFRHFLNFSFLSFLHFLNFLFLRFLHFLPLFSIGSSRNYNQLFTRNKCRYMSHHHTVENMVVINNCYDQKNHNGLVMVMVMVVSCCVLFLSQFFSSVTSARHSSIIWEGMKWKKHLFSIVCDSVPSRRNIYFPSHFIIYVMFYLMFAFLLSLLTLDTCLLTCLNLHGRERERKKNLTLSMMKERVVRLHLLTLSFEVRVDRYNFHLPEYRFFHTLRNFQISTKSPESHLHIKEILSENIFWNTIFWLNKN